MKTIVIATNNNNKIKEIYNIFNVNNIELKTLKDVDVTFDVDETGLTFKQNAIKKAKEYYKICGKPVIAEDSGLCIDAFGGLPGVFSKRLYEGKTEEEGNKIILEDLALENTSNRKAHYIAVYAYYNGTDLIISEGIMNGHIMDDIAGTNGFAYDKIFYSTEIKKRVSEASNEEKDMFSHRRKGLDKLKEKLNLYGLI